MAAIEAEVAGLFAMIAEELPAITQALLSGDEHARRIMAERDLFIDSRYVQIEELTAQTILLQAPVGYDLRILLSVLRVVPELERAHDLIAQLAVSAGQELHQALSPRSRELAGQLAALAGDMWRRATVSWERRDRTAVVLLREDDMKLGELHASLLTELAAGQMPLPVIMEMTVVARLYQRLGARAISIVRRIPDLTRPA